MTLSLKSDQLKTRELNFSDFVPRGVVSPIAHCTASTAILQWFNLGMLQELQQICGKLFIFQPIMNMLISCSQVSCCLLSVTNSTRLCCICHLRFPWDNSSHASQKEKRKLGTWLDILWLHWPETAGSDRPSWTHPESPQMKSEQRGTPCLHVNWPVAALHQLCPTHRRNSATHNFVKILTSVNTLGQLNDKTS